MKTPPSATARDCADDVVDYAKGVQLDQLLPFTTLLVRTMNSLYRVVVVEATDVYVQGGEFFHDPQLASLDGSITAQRCLKVGWIGVGRMMEIRAQGRRITTSPVRGIIVEPPSSPVVH
jgi:hypothetical protein